MILGNPSSRRDSFFLLPVLFLFLPCICDAQGIIGIVRDQVTLQPIPGARIEIMHDSVTTEVVSDSSGQFNFTSGTVAHTFITATAIGYTDIGRSGALVQLDGYSTHRIELFLQPSRYALREITIRGSLTPPHYAERITKDDLLQVAGNFDDPVRIAQSKPGIVLINDQANHMSVRGQSPILNSWFLEGLEIVNPSHTSNAGTINDQPTAYGGGINLFSAQVLGNTDVYTGINPIHISRTAGGVIDMHLHETANPEYRAKAGLLGFELGGGNPIGKGFLDYNLRYSFTGLLADFGVDFDGEKIGFYDGVLSFYQSGAKYKLKVFTWAGRSTNDFEPPVEESDRAQFKDFFHINYENDILGAGATLDLVMGKKSSLRLGSAYSTAQSSHRRRGIDPYANIDQSMGERQRMISSTIEVAFAPFDRFQWSIGANYGDRNFSGNYPRIHPLQPEKYIRPYAGVWFQLTDDVRVELGGEVKSIHNPGVSTNMIGGYRILGYIRHSIVDKTFIGYRKSPGQYVQYAGFSEEPYFHTLLVDKVEAGWQHTGMHSTWSLKAYHQTISNMTVYGTDSGFLHLADFTEPVFSLSGLGSGLRGSSRYYGLEASFTRSWNNRWHMEANQSLLQADRKFSNAEWSPGKFNTGFITHAAISREIIRERNGKNRIWNFSLRGILQGGFREPVISETASAAYLQTVYSDAYSLDNKLPVYKRIDLGIYRTITTARFRWRYALDIQNAFGFKNEAYHYFDPFLDRIATKEHLGIIPVLSVQLSW